MQETSIVEGPLSPSAVPSLQDQRVEPFGKPRARAGEAHRTPAPRPRCAADSCDGIDWRHLDPNLSATQDTDRITQRNKYQGLSTTEIASFSAGYGRGTDEHANQRNNDDESCSTIGDDRHPHPEFASGPSSNCERYRLVNHYSMRSVHKYANQCNGDRLRLARADGAPCEVVAFIALCPLGRVLACKVERTGTRSPNGKPFDQLNLL